ncbi:MAG: fabD [Planctomycetaceae bacterium]|nr:fabD [Planctomycetaceae bacterium]
MSKIAFLFPGQGAQHVGMGRAIVEKSAAARALFEQASEILNYDLAKLCFEGPADRLDTTEVSQPAIYVTSLACLELLKAENPAVVENCSFTAGLSLGEYTALVFAGAMSFADGLRVVQKRGQAMQAAANATPSGMVSILLLDREKVLELCRQASDAGPIQIANNLCPGNIVVSGAKAACEKIAELAPGANGRAIPLPVAGAFHTDIMKPADQQLAVALASVGLKAPRIPVISNVDALPHSDPAEIRDILVRQVLNPVMWEDSMRSLLAQGVTQMYEIGPGKVLKGLMKRIDRKLDVTTINDSP